MKKYILPVVITVFTVFILARHVPIEKLHEIPRQVSLSGLLAGFALYLISYMIVALRWRVLFAESLEGNLRASFLLLLLMTGSHQFYANFLPARTGDLTILYLAKRHLKIDSSLSMSSLIIARAFDFLVLGILAVGFVAWQQHEKTILHPASALVAAGLFCLPVAGIVSALLWGKMMATWMDGRCSGRGERGIFRLTRFLSRTIKTLSEKKPGIFYVKCLGLSMGLMIVRAVLFGIFVFFSPHSLSFFSGCLVGLCTLVASTIPLQGFLGLGPFEGGWVLGYVLAGRSPEEGIISAVNAHLLIILFLISLGLMSNIMLFRYAREKP